MGKITIEKKLSELCERADTFALPRWADLPSVGLYMDQVTELINRYLSQIPAFWADSSNITASMINNYVKSKIMPAPVKKRYTKEHLAYIMIICTLKQTFNISTIKQILSEDFNESDMAARYDVYASEFETACKNAVADIKASLDDTGGADGISILRLMSEINTKKTITEQLCMLGQEA